MKVAPITEQGAGLRAFPKAEREDAGAFRRNSANGGAEREDAGPLHCSPMAHNGLRPAWHRSRPPQLFIKSKKSPPRKLGAVCFISYFLQ